MLMSPYLDVEERAEVTAFTRGAWDGWNGRGRDEPS
jgi:hypothetical protein